MFGIHSVQDLMWRLLSLPLLILSLSVHEWAHAWSAWRLGDDTAAMQGRLTLNPLAHIDPLGTILLPILGIPFGWAKPVPVNPVRFNRNVRMWQGTIITAAAGPLSNVLIAVVCTVLTGLLLRFGLIHVSHNGVSALLQMAVWMNIALALFNLLPITPLDGSRVADGLMPYRFRPQWEQFSRYGGFILLAVIVYGNFGGGVLGGPINYLRGQLERVVHLIAGF